ncbi:MAG: single-stranded DNA-binding protein [Alphaproteobacteria bacterium]|nr:single-stranded DNA-binding protein [Alphaproteobacteria bacterium]
MIECALIGRLGRSPEMKLVKHGTLPMLSMALSVDNCKGADGPTTWVRVTLFGEKADSVAPNLAQGDRAYVEGKLSLDRWTAKDGTEKTGLSVVANLVQPLGRIGNRRPKQASGTRSTGDNGTHRSNNEPPPFDDRLPY